MISVHQELPKDIYLHIIEHLSALYALAIERKRAEEALREREENLRFVLQNMPIMMDAFDKDSNIIVWNREYEQVTGYRSDEIVGNPRALELLYPDDNYRQQMMTKWVKRGNSYYNWEWDITCKNGTIKNNCLVKYI
jgi:PAS domain S-box-containing protein